MSWCYFDIICHQTKQTSNGANILSRCYDLIKRQPTKSFISPTFCMCMSQAASIAKNNFECIVNKWAFRWLYIVMLTCLFCTHDWYSVYFTSTRAAHIITEDQRYSVEQSEYHVNGSWLGKLISNSRYYIVCYQKLHYSTTLHMCRYKRHVRAHCNTKTFML